ncbi:hypothetical protein [Pseudonocardia sp. T1-2H]|uniref:hypothetical protein n=1 Tax=Pseudonocardia sp. T1-2H TaxID=3128899 RepID=UPI0031015409
MRLISQDRVDSSSCPARPKARSTSAGESGLTSRPNAREISSFSSTSRAGRPNPVGRGPSWSVSNRSCTSSRQGRPAARISSATIPPADSAAASSRNRASCAASLRCCSACTATSVPNGSGSASRGAGAKSAGRSSSPSGAGSGSGSRPASRAAAAAIPRGAPNLPSAATSSPSTSSTSWQRATRPPAPSSRR